jgi:hypothetical protein
MWKEDLKFGINYEKKLLQHLLHEGDVVSHSPDKKNKGYDFILNGIQYEVKTDRFKSGNICIEVACNGKKSGITTTTADVWLYYIISNSMLINIPTEELKKIVENHTFYQCKGGDRKASLLNLVKINDIPKEYISTVLIE